MHADSDAAFCSHMFEDTSKNVANLTSVQISDCSHWANQDRPEIVNEHLKAFFSLKKGGAVQHTAQ